MKQYAKNPRKITDEQMQQLVSNLKKFGDLGSITHDLETDEIISGNQRAKAIDINKQDIKILIEFKKPKKDGTLKIGWLEWEGAIFLYRAVRFKSDEDREMANITANKLGGFWDYSLFGEFKLDNLLKWGFEKSELKFLLPDIQTNKEIELSELHTENKCPKCGYEW